MSEERHIATPAPADRPSYTIRIGGAQISSTYQVQAVTVSREINRIASADVSIYDGEPAAENFPASDGPDFVPGNEIEILAGYHGDEQRVFKGIIARHSIRLQQGRPSVLRLECRDAAMKLTVGRKSAYFYDVTDSDLIEQIARDAGLETDVESSNVTHPQMVQFDVTNWDFMLLRAQASGKLVVTRDGTLILKSPPPSSAAAVLTLRHGGNVLDLEAVIDARPQVAAVKATAWSCADQALAEAEAAAPQAAAPGNLSSDELAAVVGLETLALRQGTILDTSELQAWADGARTRSALAKVRGRVRVQGTAAITPGEVIELAGVGGRFSGKAMVSGVRHEIDTRNWETDISFGLAPEAFGEQRRAVESPAASALLPPLRGLQVGLVTALEGDPAGESRIQVRLPVIDPDGEGVWARIACLDAGAERGSIFRPEVDDEVVVGFLADDPRHPVVLGQLHSSAKAPPWPPSDDNYRKGIVTRSGMQIVFDDDKQTVLIATSDGNSLLMSDEDSAITLADANGNKLVLDADGITIESAADVNIKASGDVKAEGANLNASASAQLKIAGSGGAEISSSGSTIVKGSIVQIN